MNNRAFSLTIFRKLSYFQFETIRGLIPLLSTFPPLLAGRQLAFYCTGFWSILSDHFLDKDDASFSGSRMLKKAWLKRYISRTLGKSFSSFDLLTLWFAIRAVALHFFISGSGFKLGAGSLFTTDTWFFQRKVGPLKPYNQTAHWVMHSRC